MKGEIVTHLNATEMDDLHESDEYKILFSKTYDAACLKKQVTVDREMLSIPNAAFQKITSSGFKLKMLKNEPLIKYKQAKCDYLFFVMKGSLLHFVIGPAGSEKAIGISIEDSSPFCYATFSFFSGKRSKEKIIAMETCELMVFTRDKLEQLAKADHHCLKIYMHMVNRQLLFHYERLNDLISLPAQDAIAQLFKKYPDIEKRVSSKHIAQMIGISEEWMSKLKNKIASTAEEKE